MIRDVNIGKEIVVTVPNKIGILANISKILADHAINIEGLAGYGDAKEAQLMFVVDDTLRAIEAIIKAGYKAAKESEIIILDIENKPGALKGVTAKLAAEKIDIKYIYATVCPGGCPSRIILKTNNNEKAVVHLKS